MSLCRLCGASGEFPVCQAPERMFATGEIFSYFRCRACGCLQISEIPADLSRYYPKDYYSYRRGQASGPRARLRRLRNRGLLTGGLNPAGLLARLQPFEALAALKPLALAQNARILDVGCGQGQLVRALQELGYASAIGIDPFLEQDLNPWIRACELRTLSAEQDLIMFHHSLEHLADPAQALHDAVRLLAPQGRILIRVPTVDSWAFEHYGDCWVQWDPPRHLYLLSRGNLELLASGQGLRVRALWDDSTAFQFWGSESYRHGLPLAEAKRQFHPWYALRAAQLNHQGRGDQIVCLLSR